MSWVDVLQRRRYSKRKSLSWLEVIIWEETSPIWRLMVIKTKLYSPTTYNPLKMNKLPWISVLRFDQKIILEANDPLLILQLRKCRSMIQGIRKLWAEPEAHGFGSLIFPSPAIPCRYMNFPRTSSVLVKFLSLFYKHLQPFLQLPFSNPSLAHLSPPFISLRPHAPNNREPAYQTP